MKVLVLALAFAAAPVVASAQVAAGAIPNTFESARPTAAATQAGAVVPSIPPAPANPKAEETLRAFIIGARDAQIDYAVMSDDLAGKMRAQSASVTEVIKGFGAVQAVDWMGQRQGADVFVVNFDNAATEWLIGFNPDGRIAALLFRPAGGAATTAPAAAGSTPPPPAA